MTTATKKVLGKTDLVELIAASAAVSKVDASNALNLALDGISKALASGDDVNITGFGKFKVAHRPERQGRNPSNGQALTIKASNQVSFSVGAGLKQAVNQ